MRPFKFRSRFRIKTLFPDHVAKVEDLSLRDDVYFVWTEHPELGQVTLLRRVFTTHAGAGWYSHEFHKRYLKLREAKIAAEVRAHLAAKRAARPWWRKLWDWIWHR